jgi:ATP-dependent exoDNAse (exonuclease V) beta subunit
MVDRNETAVLELKHEIIRASAGTGKTFALSNRYLQLLVSGVDCQSILATTFSRKGAGEILDRIIRRLSDAALSDDAAANLATELQMPLNQPAAADILKQLLSNLHRLEISTLDSFFNRVAKAFSLELGLPPAWDIVDEQEIAVLEDEAIQQVLRGESVLSLLHMLSKGEATRRVASMIHDTVHHSYSVFRESGPEPWDQLEALGHFLPEDQLNLLITEMNTIAPDKKGLAKHWAVVLDAVNDGDWSGLIELKSFQNYLDGKLTFGRTKLIPEIVAAYAKLLPHCQAIICGQLINANHSTRDLLQAFGDLLERAKDATGSLRFDDVTDRLKAFVKMWDTDRFSFRLDNQIQHLLLDEFQDTSPAQWSVIEPFARKVVSADDQSRSFFCVGDMKQAIFGWRGGVAEIFDLVDDSLPGLEQRTLAKSYRSSAVVMKLVNDVFGNIKNYVCDDDLVNAAIHDWPKWFAEHTTARDLPGYVAVEMAENCDAKTASNYHRKDSVRNENVVEATVKRVRQLARELPKHLSIGVLVRKNKEVTQLISLLREKGVPASEEGGSELTDSVAVELILSALQLVDHPGDGLARFHISHSPLADAFGVAPETDENTRENEAAARVGAAKLRARLVGDGYGPVVESLARLLLDQATHRETSRLQQLVRIAYDNADGKQWQLRPSKFVQYIRDEIKVSGESSARVRVMTIHRSKGLEFDALVLPYQLDNQGWVGQTPNLVVGRKSPTDPIDIATRYAGEKKRKLLPARFQELLEHDRQQKVREAMCVLYVALTRAVHAVHVIVSHSAKPDHKSPAGVLLATLCPDAERAAGTLYEDGNSQWHQAVDLPTEEDADPHELQSFYLPGKITLKSAKLDRTVKSKRGLPKVLPSMATEGSQVNLGEVFRSRSDSAKMLRGRLLHGCFEKLRWVDEGAPSEALLLPQLRLIAPTVGDFEPCLRDFREFLQRPTIKNLFSRSGYETSYLSSFASHDQGSGDASQLAVDVQTERRFAVATDRGFIQGVIDRLILIYQGDRLIAADIVDLKTDDVADDQLHEKITAYRPQLATYREAASRFLRLPIQQIATRLVFVSTGQVVNVDVVETAFDCGVSVKKATSSRRKAGGKTSSETAEPHFAGSESKPLKKRKKPSSPKTESEPSSPAVDPPQSTQRTLWD